MKPIRIECECMTFALAERLNAELEKIRNIQVGEEGQHLKRKISHMQKVVDGLLQGKEAHERYKHDVVKQVLGVVKRREMGVVAANKRISTVPWEVNNQPKKRKKK